MTDATTTTAAPGTTADTTADTTATTTATTTTTGGDSQLPVRPEWLPETHWDSKAGTIKPEFGQHYTEVAKFHQTETERRAALTARKPEDIKFEIVLPDTVKVPEGMQLKIDPDDPRVPAIREMAVKNGWDQDTVNALVAIDAQQRIEAHNAEAARMLEEDKKLGTNAPERKKAVATWLRGLKESGTFTADEYEAVRVYAHDAAAVTALEKLIQKASGSIAPAGEGRNETTTKAAPTLSQVLYPQKAG